MAEVRYGIGRHYELASLTDGTNSLRLVFADRLLYQCGLSLTKLAVVFFYLRIFPERTSKLVCYGLLAYVVLFTTPLLLLLTFQCHPISDAWSLSPHRKCIKDIPIISLQAAFNISGDLALTVFVIPKIGASRL